MKAYQENWNFLQLLCKIPELAAIPMVFTTVNKAALENAVGSTKAFEASARATTWRRLSRLSINPFARVAETDRRVVRSRGYRAGTGSSASAAPIRTVADANARRA